MNLNVYSRMWLVAIILFQASCLSKCGVYSERELGKMAGARSEESERQGKECGQWGRCEQG
jgi:hypothetical protein